MPDPAAGPIDVEAVLAGLSLQEKVGQLLMVGFAGTRADASVRRWIQQRRVGGVALFSRNIVNLQQTLQLTSDLQAASAPGVPLFVALDQEGGNVVRVREGAMVLPGNMALGATREPTLAYLAGQGLGVDLRLLGFNMNLAPVLDVNSNPLNPVIGTRSYGENPDLVATMGEWFVRGQQEMGVVSVAKHFPGHGDTQTDSHFAMPSIDATLERLEAVELHPFKQAIDRGLDAIMTAHIALPRLTERADLPATLSHVILTDLLRTRLGFTGLIMTDGLEMQGIVQRYGSGRAAVMAILAGADMPMILWNLEAKEAVYQALVQAVVQGEISQTRLNQSVRRILTVKARRGLFERRAEPPGDAQAQADRALLHAQVAHQIARQAITLVRNAQGVLPLQPAAGRGVVVLAPPGAFGTRLGETPGITVLTAPMVPSRQARRELTQRLATAARQADVLVGAVVNRYHLEILRSAAAAAGNPPVVLVSFASPYYLQIMPEARAYVCTYSYLDTSQAAAAAALLGEHPMTGRLPVTIPQFAPVGYRVEAAL
jgi:beta-N-acetylhexosaminidase